MASRAGPHIWGKLISQFRLWQVLHPLNGLWLQLEHRTIGIRRGGWTGTQRREVGTRRKGLRSETYNSIHRRALSNLGNCPSVLWGQLQARTLLHYHFCHIKKKVFFLLCFLSSYCYLLVAVALKDKPLTHVVHKVNKQLFFSHPHLLQLFKLTHSKNEASS